jgi:hypothetical protein
MMAAVEYDGSGNAMPRNPAKPAPKPKTVRYGVLDASAAYPRVFSGGMSNVSTLFAALATIERELRSEHARLSSTGKADLAVWFGRDGGWSWICGVPYPGISPLIEWRDGCSRCGSLEHVACAAKLGAFNPDPPTRPEQAVMPTPNAPALGVPFSPAREHVAVEEQAEFDRIGREHPHLVAAARQSTATLTQAYRLAIRNLAEMEAANATG